MNRRMGCAVWTPAIPAAVGHLLFQQVAGNGIKTGVLMLEVREDGKNHPRDARLASTRPFRPGAVIDAAVALKPSVEKELAGLSRMPNGWQTEVTEQQHRVGGRRPFWRVEAAVRGETARPRALRVLSGEQTRAPAVARNFSPLSFYGGVCSSDQIPKDLPPNGRVPIQQPLDHPIRPRSRRNLQGAHGASLWRPQPGARSPEPGARSPKPAAWAPTHHSALRYPRIMCFQYGQSCPPSGPQSSRRWAMPL